MSSEETMQLRIEDNHVVMDNGILQVYLSKPSGFVTRIQYNGIDNLLEAGNEKFNRGYWDVVWSKEGSTGTTGTFERIVGTSFNVIVENEEQIEISFTRMWDPSMEGKLSPLNIDKRYVMLRDSSGFYCYAIFEHQKEWPAFNIPQIRIVFKLREDKFHYMAVADNRQRFMPLPEDRSPGRGKVLVPPEAVLLADPVEPEFKGEMFLSAHYAGEDLVLKLSPNEPWKKVFGPTFIYLNALLDGEDPLELWEDAKDQMNEEVENWPYDFPASEDFQISSERGSVNGTLLVRERMLSDDCFGARGAYVGLAPPGEAGSWQRECKGYQFWSIADDDGYFSIDNIRSGDYNIYAWVPGFIGDYRSNYLLTITPGCDKNLSDIIFEPPRDGPTLWEIGIPDRSAAEFYVPGPNPNYINKLYIDHPDKFRQYGLWERYSELYPREDLIYTVGVSDYSKDWFFAHVTRKKDDGTYQGTTWQIKFDLAHVEAGGTYRLRLALASANVSELQVRVNDEKQDPPLFTTGVIGNDNAIARHGIHGLYWLFTIDVLAHQLLEGNNTIYLTQAIATGPFQGIMYDYIRFECPNSSSVKEIQV
ncbi:probable rhamnogalacturonate lyase B isoform X2 [Arachis stenosperma]|uniref:probable rhamnogalacturonate lyase B isoform X2 n=1 Tax=Arachis stenosperma TaxID=217475 RepID=UPI0025AC4191|nr:probable rhamnogalacturonate lyase B isoform X2 [Arachis stenosperma]